MFGFALNFAILIRFSMTWEADHLPAGSGPCSGSLGGRTTLRLTSVIQVLEFMAQPILYAMGLYLQADGMDVDPSLLLRYILFRVGVGMLRPRTVDDIWASGTLHHSPYLASFLPRKKYYAIHRMSAYDVPPVLQLLSETWSGSWEWGCFAAGDEILVPHKGKKAGGMRQFIPRKPHPTGIKLYALCDGTSAYCADVYLYMGKQRNPSTSPWAGSKSPSEMVLRWHTLLPEKTALVADTYFGSHQMAEALSEAGRPFIMLIKRSDEMVAELAQDLPAHGMARVVHTEYNYALCVYKNPKVGLKPARCVPIVTNCSLDHLPTEVVHPRGYKLPGLVHTYRIVANGVDHHNQMGLTYRELGRMSSWHVACRAYLIRLVLVNTFTVAKQLSLVCHTKSLFDFQFELLNCVNPRPRRAPSSVHAPRLIANGRRRLCVHCGSKTRYECKGCYLALHSHCFDSGHD